MAAMKRKVAQKEAAESAKKARVSGHASRFQPEKHSRKVQSYDTGTSGKATSISGGKASKKLEVQAKKARKKPLLALVKQCLVIWEQMRPRDATAETKRELAARVTAQASGKYKELAMNHASSRVVQAVLKHGAPSDREAVWADCKEHVVEMAQSPHGSFVVKKLIATASKSEVQGIRRAFQGHVVKLFRHPAGSAVMAELYDELPPTGRNALVAEFYGREFALFGGAGGAADALASLTEAWTQLAGPKRRSILQALISGLHPIIEKGYVDPSAIHRLVSEYFQLAPADMLQDAVEALSGEAALRMVHTHDGARVGCMVVRYGTPKDRKRLLKAAKGHVLKICLDEFAYIPLIMALETVDDTQLLKKIVISEIQEHLEEVVQSKHGIKVILSLMTGMRQHLPPHACKLLEVPTRTVTVMRPESVQPSETDGDSASAGTGPEAEGQPAVTEDIELGISKKDPESRRQELLGSGEGSFVSSLVRHVCQRADEMLRSSHGATLTAALCTGPIATAMWEASRDDVTACHAAVADAAAVQPPTLQQGSRTGGPLLEDFFASRALKRMAADQSAPGAAFSEALWDKAVKRRADELVRSHAMKVVAALARSGSARVRGEAEKVLRDCSAST